ncbi:hypothetical protein PR048_008569 [Dryococelus australis]|uniref:Uncharacterized protein n=1 Tax=Dryococelus australis TaxID=614101 RepID=A0ABQ9HYF0_9NEOP|nr:hypothetical protein PR048_008569 [Dryococelus australis]
MQIGDSTCAPHYLLEEKEVSAARATSGALIRPNPLHVPASPPPDIQVANRNGEAPECKGGGKREIPEKIRRPAASSGTIPTCKNPGVARKGIEPGSLWWEASNPTTHTPRPRQHIKFYFFFLTKKNRCNELAGSNEWEGSGMAFILERPQHFAWCTFRTLRNRIKMVEPNCTRVLPNVSHCVTIAPVGAVTGGVEQRVRSPLQASAKERLTLRLQCDIWTALNIEVLRADEGDLGMEQRRNEGVEEIGDHREDSPTNGIARHGFHMRKSGVTRPRIEPGSLWWETNRLTAQPPWPRAKLQLARKHVLLDIRETGGNANRLPTASPPVQQQKLLHATGTVPVPAEFAAVLAERWSCVNRTNKAEFIGIAMQSAHLLRRDYPPQHYNKGKIENQIYFRPPKLINEAAVSERLVRSRRTGFNPRPGHARILTRGNRAGLVGEFSWGSSASPALSLQSYSYSPQLPSSALKTSLQGKRTAGDEDRRTEGLRPTMRQERRAGRLHIARQVTPERGRGQQEVVGSLVAGGVAPPNALHSHNYTIGCSRVHYRQDHFLSLLAPLSHLRILCITQPALGLIMEDGPNNHAREYTNLKLVSSSLRREEETWRYSMFAVLIGVLRRTVVERIKNDGNPLPLVYTLTHLTRQDRDNEWQLDYFYGVNPLYSAGTPGSTRNARVIMETDGTTCKQTSHTKPYLACFNTLVRLRWRQLPLPRNSIRLRQNSRPHEHKSCTVTDLGLRGHVALKTIQSSDGTRGCEPATSQLRSRAEFRVGRLAAPTDKHRHDKCATAKTTVACLAGEGWQHLHIQDQVRAEGPPLAHIVANTRSIPSSQSPKARYTRTSIFELLKVLLGAARRWLWRQMCTYSACKDPILLILALVHSYTHTPRGFEHENRARDMAQPFCTRGRTPSARTHATSRHVHEAPTLAVTRGPWGRSHARARGRPPAWAGQRCPPTLPPGNKEAAARDADRRLNQLASVSSITATQARLPTLFSAGKFENANRSPLVTIDTEGGSSYLPTPPRATTPSPHKGHPPVQTALSQKKYCQLPRAALADWFHNLQEETKQPHGERICLEFRNKISYRLFTFHEDHLPSLSDTYNCSFETRRERPPLTPRTHARTRALSNATSTNFDKMFQNIIVVVLTATFSFRLNILKNIYNSCL